LLESPDKVDQNLMAHQRKIKELNVTLSKALRGKKEA